MNNHPSRSNKIKATAKLERILEHIQTLHNNVTSLQSQINTLTPQANPNDLIEKETTDTLKKLYKMGISECCDEIRFIKKAMHICQRLDSSCCPSNKNETSPIYESQNNLSLFDSFMDSTINDSKNETTLINETSSSIENKNNKDQSQTTPVSKMMVDNKDGTLKFNASNQGQSTSSVIRRGELMAELDKLANEIPLWENALVDVHVTREHVTPHSKRKKLTCSHKHDYTFTNPKDSTMTADSKKHHLFNNNFDTCLPVLCGALRPPPTYICPVGDHVAAYVKDLSPKPYNKPCILLQCNMDSNKMPSTNCNMFKEMNPSGIISNKISLKNALDRRASLRSYNDDESGKINNPSPKNVKNSIILNKAKWDPLSVILPKNMNHNLQINSPTTNAKKTTNNALFVKPNNCDNVHLTLPVRLTRRRKTEPPNDIRKYLATSLNASVCNSTPVTDFKSHNTRPTSHYHHRSLKFLNDTDSTQPIINFNSQTSLTNDISSGMDNRLDYGNNFITKTKKSKQKGESSETIINSLPNRLRNGYKLASPPNICSCKLFHESPPAINTTHNTRHKNCATLTSKKSVENDNNETFNNNTKSRHATNSVKRKTFQTFVNSPNKTTYTCNNIAVNSNVSNNVKKPALLKDPKLNSNQPKNEIISSNEPYTSTEEDTMSSIDGEDNIWILGQVLSFEPNSHLQKMHNTTTIHSDYPFFPSGTKNQFGDKNSYKSTSIQNRNTDIERNNNNDNTFDEKNAKKRVPNRNLGLKPNENLTRMHTFLASPPTDKLDDLTKDDWKNYYKQTLVIESGTYEILDIDECTEKYYVDASHIIPLPKYKVDSDLTPYAVYPNGTLVLARYPQTTCFYKALIQEPPNTSNGLCYSVVFEDTLYPDGFSPPIYVPQKYVIPYKRGNVTSK